jgi:hypothetical protein
MRGTMKTYKGSVDDESGECAVTVYRDGEVLGPLHHEVRHSPTGLAWGYGGSGPSDLALSLLVDHLDGAPCEGCNGTGKQVWSTEANDFVPFEPGREYPPELAETESGCTVCWGDRSAVRSAMYRQFKWEVVAALPQDDPWTLTGAEIEAWLEHWRAQ